ncbi:amino acid adenylation domain-containing protein [Streptomycetaceae bacterium NBC_01309]
MTHARIAAGAASAPSQHGRAWPLTAAQRGIVAGHLLSPHPAAYNTAEYIRIDGDLDTGLFDTAVRRAVSEADALRVRLVLGPDGRPVQIPDAAPSWTPRHLDLSGADDPTAAAEAWMSAEVAAPVDPFGDAPLFDHALVRVGADTWLWYHRVHHVLLDGFGAGQLARRVADVYTALAAGGEPGTTPFGSLRAVLDEEAAYAGSEKMRLDREFWTRHLADRPEAVGLGSAIAMPSARAVRTYAHLPEGVAVRMAEVARDARATWPEVLIAAVATVLCRRAGAAETVLGLPVMGRMGSAALRVPSTVLNVPPLRVRTTGTPVEVVAAVSAELRAIRRHQRYRYEDLARDLGLVGGDRRLFAAVVNVMPFEYKLQFGETARATAHNVSAGPVADLAVNVYDRRDGGGPHVVLDANPACCDADDVAEFAADFVDELSGRRRTAAAAPTASAEAGRPADVLELVRAVARDRPGAVAVDAGELCWTYRELAHSVEAFATRLGSLGVVPGDHVALSLPRGPEAVIAQLAVLARNAAYVPLDPDGPEERTRTVLDDTRPRVVVTAAMLRESDARPGAGATPLTQPPSPNPPNPSDPSIQAASTAPAYVIHTSGSTGRPKGVVVPRAALAAFTAAAGERYGPGPDDRVLQFAAPHFDASVEEVFLTLSAGATLVMDAGRGPASAPTGHAPSVHGLLRECAARRITWLGLPTAYWNEVAHAVAAENGPELPQALRTVVIGGEAALPEHVRAWRRARGADRIRLVNTYGPTETCVVALTADLAGPHASYAGGAHVPVGRPVTGMTAAVLDPAGRLVEPGSVGELLLIGSQLANGYLRGPQETRARFAPVAALPGRPRGYRTGDLVRVGRDGQLSFVGRTDDEVKVSGHRVRPAEVEAALTALTGVRQAAAVAYTDSQGATRVRAFVVNEGPPGAHADAPTETDLRTGLLRLLPRAVVPASFRFLDKLPLTSAGKADRAALRASFAGGDDNAVEPSGERTDLVDLIAQAWRDALDVPLPGPDDDFFALGGQSLQIVQVANRLSLLLGREVPVADVFGLPTPRELADHLRDSERTHATERAAHPAIAEPLPDHIRLAGTAPRPGTPARRILLTGATGFVGAHLLARLAATTDVDVVCLVRGPEPLSRLAGALATWGLDPRLPEARIRAVSGDLALPDLGLAPGDREALTRGPGRVDAVVHAAAGVSLLRGESSLRAVNVDAIIRLLELASESRAFFHHISTLSVAGGGQGEGVPEAFLPTDRPPAAGGYAHGKRVAEHLHAQAAARGLPVAVHRLGRVTGARATGIVNPQDILWRILAAGLPAGALPLLHASEVWTPVDELASDLARLVTRAPTPGLVVHHAPAEQGTAVPVHLDRMHAWLREYGYRFDVVPIDAWTATVARHGANGETAAVLAMLEGLPGLSGHSGLSGPPRPTTGLPSDSGAAQGPVHAEQLSLLLEPSAPAVRAVDRDLMHRYLDHGVRTGLLPRPGAARGQAPNHFADSGNSASATSDYT